MERSASGAYEMAVDALMVEKKIDRQGPAVHQGRRKERLHLLSTRNSFFSFNQGKEKCKDKRSKMRKKSDVKNDWR
jgi:hypothetical protein